MNPQPEDLLGRYRLKRVLGEGAMAVVYEAVDPALDRLVAVKALRSGPTTEDYATRFQTEARAIGRLTHPNIVAVYDTGRTDGQAYIAMELVRGRDLADILRSGERLPLHRSLLIVSQLLSALDYAHRFGVVHRDVKPGNVLLTDDWVVKLTDFGIARINDAGDDRTRMGDVLGTPRYMAPEQLRGHAVDSTVDVFAAGVILYELLTGELPFTGDSMFGVALSILNEQPKAPSTIDPTLPRTLDRVVLRALAKRPADRYATAEAFRDALSSFGDEHRQATPSSRSGAPVWPKASPVRNSLRRWLTFFRDRFAMRSEPGESSAPAPSALPMSPDGQRRDEGGDASADLTMLAPAPMKERLHLDAASQGMAGDRTMLFRPATTAKSGPVSLMVVRSDVASMLGQRFSLGGETRIGRSDAEIVLPDALISRQHAVVHRSDEGVTITDLGSANGTLVNGLRLQDCRPYPLLPGAQVGVGTTVLALAMELQSLMDGLAGSELAGRYVLTECMYVSPKGALYRALRKGTQLSVAVKLLAPDYSQWSSYRESFAVEAEIAAGLQHPHICRLEDHGEADLMLSDRERKVSFLVYEILGGGSLGARMVSLAALPTATIGNWICDLASALDHVHRKGLVHGGLKPSAICFDVDDNVYLTDFAQSRSQPGQSAIFGAPAYMAPELWQGQAVSAASDQYALGVVAYLLLSGGLPYSGQEVPSMRERNLGTALEALHGRAGGRVLGPAVTTIVARALAADPAQRYPSAAEFARHLADALHGHERAVPAYPVFISYERASATAWVTLIAQELAREHDVRCFVDAAALDRAESFPARVREAIRDCQIFVCILGTTTLQSKWVREEIAIAGRHRKTMVPVLLEGFVPSAEDLKVRSIRALLQHGGERVLDRQNLFIREAIHRICLRVKSGLTGLA